MSESILYDVIVFHYPCQDGLVSAWISYYYHKKINHKIDLYPYQHNNILDFDRLHNKKVLFCDITPNIEILEKLEKHIVLLNVLDHHHYIKELAEKKSYIKFDNSKSGASLTWEWFFPDIAIPEFVKMVEDRDIWRWSIPNSKAFTTWLATECEVLDNFDKIFDCLDKLLLDREYINICIEKGTFLLDINNSKIKKICNDLSIRSIKIQDKQYNVCFINSTENISEIGNELCKKYSIDFAIVFHYNNIWKSSLRSIGDFDTSVISRIFGGNGHKNASGFVSNVNPLELFNVNC